MRRLVEAELRVLWRRPTGRMAVIVGTLLPVVVAIFYGTLHESSVQLNDKSISELMNFSGPDAASRGLLARHFFVMPLFWFALAGHTIAGERSDHMLRERAVRPISRDHLFVAKLMSLWLVSIWTLVAGSSLSLLLTTPWLGGDGPWLDFLGSVGLSVFTDLGVIAVAMMLATWVRSSTMTVVAGLMIMGLDSVIRLGLSGRGLLGVTWAPWVHQVMWGSGLGVWSRQGADWSWLSLASLLTLTGAALLESRRRINGLDLP